MKTSSAQSSPCLLGTCFSMTKWLSYLDMVGLWACLSDMAPELETGMLKDAIFAEMEHIFIFILVTCIYRCHNIT